jgi:FAD/FMN-containing dehydrogenase
VSSIPSQRPRTPDDPFEALRVAVAGPVLDGADPAQHAQLADEIGTFNLAVVHHPAVVVGATCTADVAAAVRYAGATGLPVAVQATGHAPVQPADGAALVSTRRMQDVTIDPAARTARIGAGVRWSTVMAAAAEHGLAPLSGSSSNVGAVGYALGGGVGALSRQHGFAADHVRSLQVVTADGAVRLLTAGDERDADLFWALRGGKSNFGIVTEMVVDLFPVSTLFGGGVFFAGSAASDVLHAYRSWADSLPDETTTSIALLRLPPLPHLPEPVRGQFVVHLRFAHDGDAEVGQRLLDPMLAAGPIVLSSVGEMPYTAVDAIHMDPTEPMPSWERGSLLHSLPAEAVDALVGAAGPDVELPLVLVELRQLGGALARPPRVPNAVAGRGGAFQLFTVGPMVPGLAEVVPVAGSAVHEALRPWSTGTSLLNHLGDATTPARVGAAYEPETLRRLLEVKAAYDPGNLFRFGHALGLPADRTPRP